MGVVVSIVSQQYLKQWVNGPSFGSDLTNYTNNLAGSVMQKFKLIQQIDVIWETTKLGGVEWDISTAGVFFREDAGSFLADGFSTGDTALWYENTVYMANITVNSISPDGKYMYYTLNSGSVTNGDHPYLVGVTPLTSLIYNYGLIENSDQYSSNSLVNNENQGWYTLDEVGADDGMGGRLTNTVAMEGLGVSNAWENGSCTVAYVSTANNKQRFQVEHEFIIPYFVPGGLSDLENDILPTYLQGANSLKYVFEADFRTVISNPNTSKKARVTNVLGSVGGFGENFNGFDTNYYVDSVTYTDNALNTADGVLQTGTTIVTATIKKILGNFAANDNVGIYFSYLPELDTEVTNTVTTFEENFMYDNIFCLISGSTVAGSGILNNAAATFSTNTLTVTFETTLTTAQQLRLNQNSNYLIGFEVGDSTIPAGTSDIVMLKEVKPFDISADIPDLITQFELNVFPHTEYFAGGGFTDFKGWIEDGLALKGLFEIDLDLQAFINSMNVYLVAHNSTSNSYFILDQYQMPLGTTQLVTVGTGYTFQIINENTTRGYQLVSGSEKNQVSLVLDSSSLGANLPIYNFTFPQKIKWEDWIKNLGVNNIFYNASKPNNNLNYKSSNYSNLAGYQIKMMVEVNMAGVNSLGVAGNTIYRYFSPNFRIFDYDLDSYTTPRFTQVIKTYHPTTLADLGGAILQGEDTLFEVTWTDTLSPILDISPFYGIHRIEVNGGFGNIYELSSYETNELTNNLLKPISGNFLTKTLTAGKLVTTCLIDGTKLQAGTNYDISARIDSPSNPKVSPPSVRVDNDGNYLVDELGNYRRVI